MEVTFTLLKASEGVRYTDADAKRFEGAPITDEPGSHRRIGNFTEVHVEDDGRLIVATAEPDPGFEELFSDPHRTPFRRILERPVLDPEV